jgi:predicted enzyme related to lactoylglutathione lyase
MFFENLVLDAHQPQVRGRFWEQALGTQNLTDEPDILETRLSVDGGPTLDLCFQQVSDPLLPSPRVHLDLHGGGDQEATVQRLLGLGATHLDVGQGDVPWVVLADPEGHPFCVLEEREAYRDTGPIAAVVVQSEDPARDAAFWAALTGWRDYAGTAPQSLRDPSGRGPVLEFLATTEPKAGKNQLHLDLRLEPADDLAAVLERVEAVGAVRIDHDWGDLPWTSLVDPSGNEFCFLPVRAE